MAIFISVSFVDGPLHGPLGDDGTEAPLAVDLDGGGSLADDLGLGGGHDVAAVDAVDVRTHEHDAVRVVALEVGADLMLGDDLGMIGGVPAAW